MTYHDLTEPLTNKARKALCASIANWSYRVNSSYKTCPLCCIYHVSYTGPRLYESCEGCPVKMVTKQPFCRGTPYENCFDYDYRINELEFLLSILIQDRKFRKDKNEISRS